jgi:hypothetical protein
LTKSFKKINRKHTSHRKKNHLHILIAVRKISYLFVACTLVLFTNPLQTKDQRENIPPKRDSEKVKSDTKNATLGHNARFYSWVNVIVSGFGFSTSILYFLEIFTSENTPPEKEEFIAIGTLCLLGGIIFSSRFFWTYLAFVENYTVSDDSDDYSLERTTFFAWLCLVVISFLRSFFDITLRDLGLNNAGDWIVALALWTPIVHIIGPGWGKLKAIHPKGKQIVWPDFRIQAVDD